MTAPEFVVALPDGEAHDSISAEHLTRIGDVLLNGGFVLLPSDTSYSVAVLPLSQSTREQLNILLKRPDQPLSLAFPDLAAASRWVAPNPVVTALLERFCPGPITVVARVSFSIPAQVVDRAVAGPDRTIGVRIPNSAVERAVAATLRYPITTTAVFDPATSRPVTDFSVARAFVEARVGMTRFSRWCAIEGTIDYEDLSTVVRVAPDGRLDPVRPGAIPLDDIEACRSLTLQEQQ
jgi:L-threonylcarbamoyladenylate synthase